MAGVSGRPSCPWPLTPLVMVLVPAGVASLPQPPGDCHSSSGPPMLLCLPPQVRPWLGATQHYKYLGQVPRATRPPALPPTHSNTASLFSSTTTPPHTFQRYPTSPHTLHHPSMPHLIPSITPSHLPRTLQHYSLPPATLTRQHHRFFPGMVAVAQAGRGGGGAASQPVPERNRREEERPSKLYPSDMTSIYLTTPTTRWTLCFLDSVFVQRSHSAL